MKLLVTGASGFVGARVMTWARSQGHVPWGLTRDKRRAGQPGWIHWDPRGDGPNPDSLQGIQGVIHLAGESIDGRWTRRKKERIRNSRLEGTRRLVKLLARMDPPPQFLFGASAVGIYGDTADQWVEESSPPGDGFLARLGVEW